MADKCLVCGRSEREHQFLNHLFSDDGQLTPKKEQRQAPRGSAPAIDVVLRYLLLKKGIITGEELLVQEADLLDRIAQTRRDADGASHPANASGDRENRSSEGAGRSVRGFDTGTSLSSNG